MAYIFMDESGDLSFNEKRGTSKFFNITFLYIKQRKIADSIMKKLHQRKKGKGNKINDSFFHSCHERKDTILKGLQIMSNKELYIMNLSINKKNLKVNSYINKHELYNKAVDELINFVINSNYLNNNDPIYFIASRRETNKTLNNKFINYLENNHKADKVKFSIGLPINEKGLQIVDIASYAISKKYESNDNTMYNVIQNKILIEEKI